jgi:hypothetical protein
MRSHGSAAGGEAVLTAPTSHIHESYAGAAAESIGTANPCSSVALGRHFMSVLSRRCATVATIFTNHQSHLWSTHRKVALTGGGALES